MSYKYIFINREDAIPKENDKIMIYFFNES